MNTAELDGLLSQLGPQCTSYRYFKDKYALLLAGWAAGDGLRIGEMKQSRLGGLLQKDLLKQHCARNPVLRAADLLAIAPHDGWSFSRSLDQWGEEDNWGWTQVSRPGISLVLRLDFGPSHDRKVSKLRLGPAMETLRYRNHMRDGERLNLAWARLDLDLETGEVLIEEIQNDWLRSAQDMVEEGQSIGNDSRWYHVPRKSARKNDLRFLQYHKEMLAPLEKIWSEAMLCATLEFIRNDLGLHTVYMHTPDCGARLKGISYSQPPRSIYTDLPRRFCFEQTDEVPTFLSRSWGQMEGLKQCGEAGRRAKPFSFWKMEL